MLRELLFKFQSKECFISNQRQHSAQTTEFETVCLCYCTTPFFLGALIFIFYYFGQSGRPFSKTYENSNQSANDDARNRPNVYWMYRRFSADDGKCVS